MSLAKKWTQIFYRAIEDYHVVDHVDQAMKVPFHDDLDALLYHKAWIDVVQWHLEDIIRDPNINPVDALQIKRRIDKSNQERTDRVEQLDLYFMKHFAPGEVMPDARLNTESPAWAVDRLSILCLKIYHMREEVERSHVDQAHRDKCIAKLAVLEDQMADLTTSIDQLIGDIESGRVQMKLYRQMKMYNDPELNPVLYGEKND